MKDYNTRFRGVSERTSPEAKDAFGAALTPPPIVFKIFFAGALIFAALTAFEIVRFRFQPTRHIVVEGNKTLSDAFILERLNVDKTRSYTDIDPYILTRRLKRIAWVKNGRVRKVPPLDLEVILEERVPAAYLRTSDKILLIDRTHTAINLVKNREWELPVIADRRLKGIQPGERLSLSTLDRAFDLMKILKDSRILNLETVSEIDVTDPVDIRLITIPNGVVVKMGLGDFDKKLSNLFYAMPEIRKIRKRIRSLDLRYAQRVIAERK